MYQFEYYFTINLQKMPFCQDQNVTIFKKRLYLIIIRTREGV